MSDCLKLHDLQHTRLPCPSPTPGTCSSSCPLSRWYHPTTSSSVTPFFSCPQSFPASESFQWVGSLHQVTKVLGLCIILHIICFLFFSLSLVFWNFIAKLKSQKRTPLYAYSKIFFSWWKIAQFKNSGQQATANILTHVSLLICAFHFSLQDFWYSDEYVNWYLLVVTICTILLLEGGTPWRQDSANFCYEGLESKYFRWIILCFLCDPALEVQTLIQKLSSLFFLKCIPTEV